MYNEAVGCRLQAATHFRRGLFRAALASRPPSGPHGHPLQEPEAPLINLRQYQLGPIILAFVRLVYEVLML